MVIIFLEDSHRKACMDLVKTFRFHSCIKYILIELPTVKKQVCKMYLFLQKKTKMKLLCIYSTTEYVSIYPKIKENR